MSATFVSDARAILNEADATTGWTATDGPTVTTSAPDPIESTACLAMQVSNAVENAYLTITSDDYSGGGTLSIWMADRASFDTTANGGIGIQVGDGSNRIAYFVGGSDGTGFRHDTGPVKWACFVLDLANKPANFTALAGSEASLNEAAITQVGVYFKTIAKSVGGADNCFWDIIRFANPGDAVVFVGGTTSGTAGNGSEIATLDRSTGNQQAYGVIRQLGTGVYGIQGNITLGNSASSSDQYWSETNATYVFEDRSLSAANYYRFILIGSATATNCEFSFLGCTFVVGGTADASFNGNGANITVCTLTGSNLIGFGQGVQTSDDTGDNWEDCAFINCGQITANGCLLNGGSFEGYEGTANTSYLVYNLAVDPDGELDSLSFTKGTAATHAIEFGTSSPTTMTLRGCDFSGYNASDANNDSTFHFRRTTGSVTLNLIGCSGNFSFRTDGAAITIVADPVTVQVTALAGGSPLQDARVLLEAADGTGPFPYLESVTISNAATTATVTHTTHGMATGDKVVIRGASLNANNGVFTITVNTANEYEYTMGSSPGSSPTGTITASFVALEGLTDVSGIISASRVYPSDQPVTGKSRKATSAPYYKTSELTGTVDSATGLTINTTMILDQ